MKKSISLIAMTLGSVICLNSCNDKESLAPSHGNEGVPFEIAAGFQDTKTINDGMETKWTSGDAINLFHASAGTSSYVNDNQFTLDDTRDGVFTGTLTGELTEGAYDWYAFYPYSSYNTTPASKNQGYNNVGANSMTQDGNDSKAHLSGKYCPLYGVTKSVSNDVRPTMVMNNLTSVIAVVVKNTTDAPLQVTSVSFTSTEDIVGTYYIDFTGDEVVYTPSGDKYVYSTASLTVTNGKELASNESATFYIPVKPHTVASGAALKLSVNGYEKSITLTKDITFTAGKIKTLNFNFDKVSVKEEWTMVTSVNQMVDGEYVILAVSSDSKCGYLPTTAVSKAPTFTSQSIFDGTTDFYSIDEVPVSMRWTFTQSTDKTWNIKKGNLTLYNTNVNNGVVVGNPKSTTNSFWTISEHENDATKLQFVGTDSRYLSVYANQDWRCYTSIDQANSKIILYYCGKFSTEPSIKAYDEVKVSARAESAGELNYSVLNPTTETMVATCDGTVVSYVTAEDGICLYVTSDNVSASPREGWIKLTYGSVEKIIKVTQAAPVFTLSSSEVILGAEDNATATVTVISDFDWVSDITYDGDESLFVIDPSVCSWAGDDAWKAASGETKVSVIAEANTSTSERTLGTITFTDAKTSATQTVTIKQRGVGDTPVVSRTVTYEVATRKSVNISGEAPMGSSVTFESTSTNANEQMTSGSSQTYTLKGYSGKTIKSVVLSMKSNASKGAGTFSLTVGKDTIASISSSTTFNKWFDNTSYGSSYRDVNVKLTDTDRQVGIDEDVVLIIKGTANSLYCQSVTIVYE